jgi:peptidoglycan/LPS O-acetylase OafA/YrhL
MASLNGNFAVRMINPSSRIYRVDSLRFIAALWVVFSHGILPTKSSFSDPVAQLIASALGASFDGISAVMVFFIVSGLCIHWPFVNVERVPLANFLARRYLRIGMPLATVLIFMSVVGGNASERGHEVLWSIYAELVYYTIYPVLFLAARRFGWGALISCSGVISIALVFLHPVYTNVQQFGPLTWLWGLPIWLAGCVLAERLRSGRMPNLPGNIWLWRLGAWGLGVLALFGEFHSRIVIGYPISMLPFAVYGYFWLNKELANQSPGWQWLERCGRASYSLYLVHNIVLGAVADYFPHTYAPILFPFSCAAIGAVTYLFYRLVERPSHLLARRIATLLSGPAAKSRIAGKEPFLFDEKA